MALEKMTSAMTNVTFCGSHLFPWVPYNIRHHKGHDDQWINNIPPFGLVDVKSLPTGSKDFLYKKTEHKGQYNPVWKGNKGNLEIAFRQDYKNGDRLKTRTAYNW